MFHAAWDAFGRFLWHLTKVFVAWLVLRRVNNWIKARRERASKP